MTRDELLQLHFDTCKAAQAIMESKNQDYTCGDADVFANFRASAMFGVPPALGILLRITDKLKRVESFVRNGTLAVKSESVDDAIGDVINYMILLKGVCQEDGNAVDGATDDSPKELGPLTYLVCPYTHEDAGVRAARLTWTARAAAYLHRRGDIVFSPLTMTVEVAARGSLPDTFEFWEEFDTTYLRLSRKLVVLTMPGWGGSVGVNKETEIANALGIPVEFLSPDVVREAEQANV
jgi:hypothetical protein